MFFPVWQDAKVPGSNSLPVNRHLLDACCVQMPGMGQTNLGDKSFTIHDGKSGLLHPEPEAHIRDSCLLASSFLCSFGDSSFQLPACPSSDEPHSLSLPKFPMTGHKVKRHCGAALCQVALSCLSHQLPLQIPYTVASLLSVLFISFDWECSVSFQEIPSIHHV